MAPVLKIEQRARALQNNASFSLDFLFYILFCFFFFQISTKPEQNGK